MQDEIYNLSFMASLWIRKVTWKIQFDSKTNTTLEIGFSLKFHPTQL